MKDNNNLYSEICKIIIEQVGRPIPAGIIVRKIQENIGFDRRNIVYDAIDQMVKNKTLKKLESGNLVEGYINDELEDQRFQGIISLNSNLDGYVKITNNTDIVEAEAYVNNINLNGALTNDLVEIQFMKTKTTKTGIKHAVVSRIVEHNTKFVIGTFQLIGNTYNIELDDTRNYLKIELDDIENLVNGHKLLIQLGQIKDGIGYGTVSRILGHKDDVGIDILSIIISHGINIDFSQEALDQANGCKVDVNDNKGVRRDITDRLIVTIDPATSKDLDDAIYIKKENDKYFLSVSIADVSHYVKYDSLLWNEAIERSTSVYLVDRVIPMLPHVLSNNICSLNPDVERLCLTCDMWVDKYGNYSDIDVYPSIIKSKKRFSYDEVNEYFDNKKSFDPELNQMLDWSKELHHILRTKKEKEGYIDFDIKEPKIIVDEKCWPIEIKLNERGIAQKMVEDFMICANEGVTIKANELKIPFIYRVHTNPKIERLELFSIEAKKLGFMTSKSDFENMTSSTISMWLNNNQNNTNIDLISKLLLRCMQKAEYSIHNIGHFGLGIKNYTHFTSPIRRTPDMLIHALYWMFVFEKDKYSDEQREKLKNSLDELTKKCTMKEIEAIQTERDVNQLKFCQYMSDHKNEIFSGTISTIKSFGIYVELDNTIEVLVKINSIGNDFWRFNAETNVIVGDKTHKTFTFGQKIDVKITDVNIKARQINAVIVGFEPSPKPSFNKHK